MSTTTELQSKASAWLSEDYDEATRAEVERLMKEAPGELEEAFHTTLKFGTGGMRGVMGVGTNRMNRYTVARSTQGFANYLRRAFGEGEHRVAIAYDCRHNSASFAAEAADVLASNGFRVLLSPELRPTPYLSHVVRQKGCKGGIVITASHNPPEYNGYKVYWEDGAQITAPHDAAIIAEVEALSGMKEVQRGLPEDRIEKLGIDDDEAFLQMIEANVIDRDVIHQAANLGIVYTPLHGTGVTLLPKALERIGFTNVYVVEEQAAIDGDFPTVKSPNPEEAEALSMAIEHAKSKGRTLVLGTDPDTDRVGIAVADADGEFQLLNGNDTGVLLTWYQLMQQTRLNVLPQNAFVAKTIVTTPLIARIAEKFQLPCYDTLTGFKHIAALIREKEGQETFVTGGEESYGYMIGDAVRDKDGVAAAAMICEMAAYAELSGMTLPDLLRTVHCEFGLYRESLVSLKKQGINGAKQIKEMMDHLRQYPPREIAGLKVVAQSDFLQRVKVILDTQAVSPIDLPESNVLQFELDGGAVVTARPSGTEPKIKFYFSVNEQVTPEVYRETYRKLEKTLKHLEEHFLSL